MSMLPGWRTQHHPAHGKRLSPQCAVLCVLCWQSGRGSLAELACSAALMCGALWPRRVGFRGQHISPVCANDQGKPGPHCCPRAVSRLMESPDDACQIKHQPWIPWRVRPTSQSASAQTARVSLGAFPRHQMGHAGRTPVRRGLRAHSRSCRTDLPGAW